MVACAADGVQTVPLISSNEIMKAEAAAASRLVRLDWLVMVGLLGLFGSAGDPEDTTLFASIVPILENHGNSIFLPDERIIADR